MKQQMGFAYNIRHMFLAHTIAPGLLLLIVINLAVWVGSQTALMFQTEKGCRNAAENIQQINTAYKTAVCNIADSQEMIDFLVHQKGGNRVFEAYYDIVLKQDIPFQMAVMNQNGEVCLQSEVDDKLQWGVADILLKKQVEQNSREAIKIFSRASQTDSTKGYWYGFGRAVYKDRAFVGYVVFYVKEVNMGMLLSARGVEQVIITNQYDTVLATSIPSARSDTNRLAYKQDRAGFFKEGDSRYFMAKESIGDGIAVYAYSSMSFSRYLVGSLLIFSFVVSVVWIVLFQKLSDKMTHRVVEPINQLMQVVEKTGDGDFKTKVALSTGDEFEILAKEYNRMTGKIQNLIMSNQELERLKRQAEFKVIRNQFNPHFLFNVLESLRYTMFIDKTEAEKIILILSKFLRYNIYNQDQYVTLEEDLQHLEDYLLLHRARFQERISWKIELEEGMGCLVVPKFLTQPFVENSVKYGFRNKEKFHISVKALKKGENFCILIEDNGGGMTEERFAQVTDAFAQDTCRDSHIGLFNANKTLKMIYGADYGIRLFNKPGEGLTVLLDIYDLKVRSDAEQGKMIRG